MTELEHVAAKLHSAVSYLDVFGTCKGDASQQQERVKSVYRKLTRVVHPDKFTQEYDKVVAQAAFVRLGMFKTQADTAIANSTYGETKPLATITTKKHTYRINRKDGSDALCDWFVGDYDGAQASLNLKVVRNPINNSFVAHESKMIRLLTGADTDTTYHPYVPQLIESFSYRAGGVNRSANAFVPEPGLVNLAMVRTARGNIHPLDMAWMWRRLLVALGYAHSNDVIHGAVTPNSIYIQPEYHGVVLDDWYWAVVKDGSEFPIITSVPIGYKDWYPSEVVAKLPPSFGTDIAMAAKSMVWLMGGDIVTGRLPNTVPKPIYAFFKGCMQHNQHARPQSAWYLLKEFDELLERLGAPYYPRKFRPFTVPLI